MNTYTSVGHEPIVAKNKTLVAKEFAEIKAIKNYGKLGEVSTCYAVNFGGNEYKAFIGKYSPKEEGVRGIWYNFDVCEI
jgi:hypothetical protein